MVAILEKIKLVTTQRIVTIKNSLGETNLEYIDDGTFEFFAGKIYGIVCEYGEGGEFISSVLSGNVSIENEKIFIDDDLYENFSEFSLGWYMGASLFNKGIIRRELTAKRAINKAFNTYSNVSGIDKLMMDFHLSEDRLGYKLSNYSHERWRVSLAIGYVCQKKIFCFPWMNSMMFYETMCISNVYRLFKKVTENGGIIILPTSRKENVLNVADYIIELNCNRFKLYI